jgi:invasion protein IalB
VARSIGALAAIAVGTMVTTAALAQQSNQWTTSCETDARTNAQQCAAQVQISYMPTMMTRKTLSVRVHDDAQEPVVALSVNDEEVRYAQLLIAGAAAPADLICADMLCQMSFDDARTVIDSFMSAESAEVRLFTNNGATVMVRIPLAGFADARAAAGGN